MLDGAHVKKRTQVATNLGDLAIELQAQIRELSRFMTVSLWDPEASMPRFLHGIDRGAKKPFTEEICKHSGFIWLFRQSEFDEAFQYFAQQIEKIKPGEWQIIVLKKMKFLYYFAGIGWQAFSDSISLPRKITTSEKARAVEIAKELLIFVKAGIGRPDYPVMENLEDPLTEFVKQIQSETKREYSGPTDRPKEILLRLARIIQRLGMKQRDVVRIVDAASAVFGFDVGHRTVQRYVTELFSVNAGRKLPGDGA